MVGERWTADNQEIEGIMNLVKIAVNSSQTISQQLIDARVGIIKEIGMGSRKTKHTKWSQCRERFEAVLEDALEHVGEANEIITDPERFNPPFPNFMPVPNVVVAPTPHTQAQLVWASKQNIMMMRATKRNPRIKTIGALMTFQSEDGRVSSFVMTHTYKHVAMLVEVSEGEHTGDIRVNCNKQTMSSLDILVSYHAICVDSATDVTLSYRAIKWISVGGICQLAVEDAPPEGSDVVALKDLSMVMTSIPPPVTIRLKDVICRESNAEPLDKIASDDDIVHHACMLADGGVDDEEAAIDYEDEGVEVELEKIGMKKAAAIIRADPTSAAECDDILDICIPSVAEGSVVHPALPNTKVRPQLKLFETMTKPPSFSWRGR